MRLIDADALKAWIDCGHLRPPTEMCFSELDVVRMLDKQPAVDAEPVRHGRWVDDMYFDEPVTRCAWCNHGFAKGHKAERFPYCPNCGAKMDLEVQGF